MRSLSESILAHERKVIGFIAKVNYRRFLCYPAAILVYHSGTPTWRLHTELYKFPWNVLANKSRTLYRTDLRLGEVVYLLIFYIIWNSWLVLLNGFEFIFVWRDSATRQYVYLQGFIEQIKLCCCSSSWYIITKDLNVCSSLLAEAPFPLYSLSWWTGRKGTSAMGRNSLWFNCRPWSWTAVSETHAPWIVCWPWLEPTVSFTVIPLSFSEPAS